MAKVAAKKKDLPIHNMKCHFVCGTCRCWERFPDVDQTPGDDVVGECLLNPPTVGFDEEGKFIQANPTKDFHSRCGQHQPQEH